MNMAEVTTHRVVRMLIVYEMEEVTTHLVVSMLIVYVYGRGNDPPCSEHVDRI